MPDDHDDDPGVYTTGRELQAPDAQESLLAVCRDLIMEVEDRCPHCGEEDCEPWIRPEMLARIGAAVHAEWLRLSEGVSASPHPTARAALDAAAEVLGEED